MASAGVQKLGDGSSEVRWGDQGKADGERICDRALEALALTQARLAWLEGRSTSEQLPAGHWLVISPENRVSSGERDFLPNRIGRRARLLRWARRRPPESKGLRPAATGEREGACESRNPVARCVGRRRRADRRRRRRAGRYARRANVRDRPNASRESRRALTRARHPRGCHPRLALDSPDRAKRARVRGLTSAAVRARSPRTDRV